MALSFSLSFSLSLSLSFSLIPSHSLFSRAPSLSVCVADAQAPHEARRAAAEALTARSRGQRHQDHTYAMGRRKLPHPLERIAFSSTAFLASFLDMWMCSYSMMRWRRMLWWMLTRARPSSSSSIHGGPVQHSRRSGDAFWRCRRPLKSRQCTIPAVVVLTVHVVFDREYWFLRCKTVGTPSRT